MLSLVPARNRPDPLKLTAASPVMTSSSFWFAGYANIDIVAALVLLLTLDMLIAWLLSCTLGTPPRSPLTVCFREAIES